jgi:hypothetical protein
MSKKPVVVQKSFPSSAPSKLFPVAETKHGLASAEKRAGMKISAARSQRKTPAKRAFSGLAGSRLSLVRNIESQKPNIPPKDKVLVHFCFDQERGASKAIAATVLSA